MLTESAVREPVFADGYPAVMLNPVTKWRHVLVGVAVVVTPAAVALGLVGNGTYPQRFDAKQVLVWPAGGDSVRIREVVDDDFGSHDGHGYERKIPTDFGTPTDISASSPDANADLNVVDFGYEVRVRLGDPDNTIDGQHRYVLAYTLPEARLSSGFLALDIINAGEELETGRFEVVLTGFELADPACHTGRYGAIGGCTLTMVGDEYHVVLEPLRAGEGITVEGRILSLDTTTPDLTLPPLPKRRSNDRLPLALGTVALGLAMAIGAFVLARTVGRNEVGGTGPADAAFAGMSGGPSGPVRKVSDGALDAMATTEFAPPRGLHPWQGAILLRERVDAQSVGAWFSEQIALERVVIEGPPQVLRSGPKLADAPAAERDRIEKLMGGDGELALGKYQPAMARLWTKLTKEQTKAAASSGWWTRSPAGGAIGYPAGLGLGVVIVAAVAGFAMWQKWWDVPLLAIGLGIAVPGLVAGGAYRGMLPARSATGSALALQAESFRRFLASSEGSHVEWAWTHGLLREYSAWAVALGAADAWNDAVAASGVPRAEVRAATMPLMVHTYATSFAGSRAAPSTSGSSSSGFSSSFSGGGFSGGGGGGGSSGNW